jgi:hypothetical protein
MAAHRKASWTFVTILLSVFLSNLTFAGSCPKEYETRVFDRDLSSLQDNGRPKPRWWIALKKIYSEHIKASPSCDDGFMAEGFDDEVPHLMSRDWENVTNLFSLMSNDRGFETFVLKHINAVSDDNELRILNTLSEKSCPKGGNQYCKMIMSRIANAAKG